MNTYTAIRAPDRSGVYIALRGSNDLLEKLPLSKVDARLRELNTELLKPVIEVKKPKSTKVQINATYNTPEMQTAYCAVRLIRHGMKMKFYEMRSNELKKSVATISKAIKYFNDNQGGL